ncbi:malonate--CoA ligase ACSF3, mitochondrial [Anabrus simplex]|uniref:malonate--CoA ligase ACSF3, mitochondrial n=1 Tax=Anabrus simplex TaxID=316456 RepID=UPI0035A27580
MASLMVGRVLVNCSGRNTITFNVISRCWQQTYAACAPSVSTPSETIQQKTSVVPVFRQAGQYCDRIALRDIHGEYTYRGIFLSSRQFASEIRDYLGGNYQERVAFLCPNDATYVITQWACFMSGQIAVPLCSLHPPNLLEYYIKDSEANLIVTTPEHAPVLSDIASKLGRKLLIFDEALRVLAMKQAVRASKIITGVESDLTLCNGESSEDLDGGLAPEFYDKSDAIIIYTSGTTGEPKGVVLSHRNLEAQVTSLVEAWEWSRKDIILHVLPLHHVHGMINALMCPLYVGARCVMLPKFESARVWANLLAINMAATERVNVFMAVPTIYMMLIEEYDRIFSKNARMKEYIRAVCSQKIRLMVSGSAPLPTPIFHRWEEITGHQILERYGMSETGMVLSNPLHGERKPGFVGTPLPNVEVQIARTDTSQEPEVLVVGNSSGTRILSKDTTNGELWVKGPGVFKYYYKRPKATEKEFTPDGWFKTGDTAQYTENSYRILGRTSVDIIKTGGYKVSAIEVETHLLGHPDIQDVAVVGLSDMTWGQKVAAVVVPRENKEIILSKLREWAKDRMAPYAIPTVLKVVDKLPKNSMGKVNKKELLLEIFPETEQRKMNNKTP